MQTLAKTIVSDTHFRKMTDEIRRALAKNNDHTPISAAFKSLSYTDHATAYNEKTVRAVNLLFPQATIADGNPIRYGQFVSAVSNAATVPNGVPSSESDYSYQPAEAVPRRIAHHTYATRMALAADALAQNVIETALLAGIENAVDNFILNSTDPLSKGLLSTAALSYTQTTTIADALLRASAQIRAANVDAPFAVAPDLAILDPASYIALRTETDAGGRFIVNPEAQEVYLWGLRVVECAKMPAKTALVLDSQSVTIAKTALDSGARSSDSHENYFTRNILTLVAEIQCAALCNNPSALSVVTLL
jgi:HK97 family phage major capsid protein